jgi:hypothetical protein
MLLRQCRRLVRPTDAQSSRGLAASGKSNFIPSSKAVLTLRFQRNNLPIFFDWDLPDLAFCPISRERQSHFAT